MGFRSFPVVKTIVVFFAISVFSQAATIRIAWDENSERDLAGYRVYWGTSSKQYQHFVDVGFRTTFELVDLPEGVRHYLAVTALDWWGNESSFSNQVHAYAGEPPLLPEDVELSVNYPNPFNPGTFFNLTLPAPMHVDLAVFNRLGQKVKSIRDSELDAGYYQIYWDATDDSGTPLAAGTYFLKLNLKDRTLVRTMTLIR